MTVNCHASYYNPSNKIRPVYRKIKIQWNLDNII